MILGNNQVQEKQYLDFEYSLENRLKGTKSHYGFPKFEKGA